MLQRKQMEQQVLLKEKGHHLHDCKDWRRPGKDLLITLYLLQVGLYVWETRNWIWKSSGFYRKSFQFDVNGVGHFHNYSYCILNTAYFLLAEGLLNFTVARNGNILPSSVIQWLYHFCPAESKLLSIFLTMGLLGAHL